LPPSAPEAEANGHRAPGPGAEADLRGLPFQWNLLAWAALVGILTGLAVVAFHELLGFINNFLFGPFVEGLLVIGRSSPATPPTYRRSTCRPWHPTVAPP